MEGRYRSEEVMAFARGFRAVEASENRYVDPSRSSKVVDDQKRMSGRPIGNCYLKKSDVDSIMKTALKLPADAAS